MLGHARSVAAEDSPAAGSFMCLAGPKLSLRCFFDMPGILQTLITCWWLGFSIESHVCIEFCETSAVNPIRVPVISSVTSVLLQAMSQLLVDDGRFGPRRVLLQLRPVWHIFLPYGLLSILSRRSIQLISAVGFLWISGVKIW